MSGELVERLRALEEARRRFVAARTAMNAAIPDIDATPAERALYDERYRADHEAERELHRAQCEFAMWAQENGAAALIEAQASEIEVLRKALEPFARAADLYDDAPKGFVPMGDNWGCQVRLADLRAARTALTDPKGRGE